MCEIAATQSTMILLYRPTCTVLLSAAISASGPVLLLLLGMSVCINRFLVYKLNGQATDEDIEAALLQCMANMQG